MASMQNLPIDHHYIPKFYTKQWCGLGDGRAERFTVEGGRLIDRRVYPEQVGKRKHLYTIPGMPAGQEQVLELDFFKDSVRQGGVISALALGHRQAALVVMCRG